MFLESIWWGGLIQLRCRFLSRNRVINGRIARSMGGYGWSLLIHILRVSGCLVVHWSSLVMECLLRIERALTMVGCDSHRFPLGSISHVHWIHCHHIYIRLNFRIWGVQLSMWCSSWGVSALSKGIWWNWRFWLTSNAFLNIFEFQILMRRRALDISLISLSTSRISLKPHWRYVVALGPLSWIFDFM
jgi:hypothetical protein